MLREWVTQLERDFLDGLFLFKKAEGITLAQFKKPAVEFQTEDFLEMPLQLAQRDFAEPGQFPIPIAGLSGERFPVVDLCDAIDHEQA